jgi:hypothetical protein
MFALFKPQVSVFTKNELPALIPIEIFLFIYLAASNLNGILDLIDVGPFINPDFNMIFLKLELGPDNNRFELILKLQLKFLSPIISCADSCVITEVNTNKKINFLLIMRLLIINGYK